MIKEKFGIIWFLLGSLMLFGQFNQNYYGFGLDIGSSGSGIFITGQSIHEKEKISLNGELRFYDIKSNNETVIYNPFYGQFETVGGTSLIMLPIFFGLNYYPFVGKIENNFSPFITTRAGYVISLDGKETGSFSDRWKNSATSIAPGGFLGAGIDFKMYGQTSVSTMVGVEVLPLENLIDGYKNHGMLIHIAFNKRFKK
tara:strand:- start:145 stop:741 length:597 start_codon:yes stop_codon:yes gene_type:complete